MNKYLLLYFFALFGSATQASPLFEKYFLDTYQCLEKMRNPSSALVVDSMTSDLKILNDSTSPTNIALDLLVQLEAIKYPTLENRAKENILQILLTLNQLNFHRGSGLFFGRYSSDGLKVTDNYLSTIDNFHLAFALWALKNYYPGSMEKIISSKLFKRMNFSFLYDLKSGLFVGGAYHSSNGWKLEAWKFDFVGSEARSLYGLGLAIGLIKDPDYLNKIIASLIVEMNGPILRLWDGGAFQLLLPRLLFNEEHYSYVLKKSFLAYGEFILEEGIGLSYPVPAAFSASQVDLTTYNGKAGSPDLVSTMNQDLFHPDLLPHWDEVFTPHAALLVAPLMPQAFEESLLSAESLGLDGPLYLTGLGWLDGYHVKGKNIGMVVPVFLSLDQGMIALASAQIISSDGMTVSSRMVSQDKKAVKKIKLFYNDLDQKLYR